MPRRPRRRHHSGASRPRGLAPRASRRAGRTDADRGRRYAGARRPPPSPRRHRRARGGPAMRRAGPDLALRPGGPRRAEGAHGRDHGPLRDPGARQMGSRGSPSAAPTGPISGRPSSGRATRSPKGAMRPRNATPGCAGSGSGQVRSNGPRRGAGATLRPAMGPRTSRPGPRSDHFACGSRMARRRSLRLAASGESGLIGQSTVRPDAAWRPGAREAA